MTHLAYFNNVFQLEFWGRNNFKLLNTRAELEKHKSLNEQRSQILSVQRNPKDSGHKNEQLCMRNENNSNWCGFISTHIVSDQTGASQ